MWIVRAIENDRGFTGAAKGFEATRPIGVTESVLHSIVAQVEAEGVKSGQSDGGIPWLVRAFEGKRVAAKWFIDDGQGCAFFVGLHGDDALGISELRGGNHGLFRTDDAGFFSGDGTDGVAEPLGVVEANWRNHADIGGHGRGGIEPTTHAGFENDQLTFALGEIFHRKGEGDLEKGRMVFERSANSVQCIEMAQAFLLRDVFTGDFDALAVVDEVRRGKKPCAHAGGAGDGIDEGAGGAFTVGAGDMDDLNASRGVGEVLAKQVFWAIEPKLDAEHLRGKQPLNGSRVVSKRHDEGVLDGWEARCLRHG